MMPVFDNGCSLFFNHAFEQVVTFQTETQFALPPWSQVTFDEQGAHLIAPRQIDELGKLAHFKFANNNKEVPFPEVFLRSLSAFTRQRAEQLAALSPVSREELLARC